MKLLISGLAVASLIGCASAEQRLEAKQSYRHAQVSIVAEQEKARTDREQVKALENAAMWQALAEVVKADPSSSGMIAMVAAVSAARTGDDGKTQQNMVMLKTEHETTALDWVKVLANPITNVGIAALNMDLQKTIARQNTLVDLANAANDGKMMDTFATLGSRDTTSYTVSDEAMIDMSVTTSGDTISGDTISDAYNTTETTTDSYNTTETTSGDTNTDSNNSTTTDSSDNSTTDSSDNSVTNPVGP